MPRIARALRSTAKRALRPVVRRLAPAPARLPPGLWELAPVPGGGLALAGHDLDALAARFGTPLHVLHAPRLDANVAALAGLEAFYSYKTHPVPAVLRRLHARGVGAEVISELELDLALRLGVPPDRIIYNGPGKSDASLRTAIARGILLLNLNHAEELPRVARAARALGRKARVGIRANARAGWSAQFGTAIAGGAALALVEAALRTPEVEVVGLHSHRGALLYVVADLDAFLAEVLAFTDLLHERLGFTPEILDLGGSLCVPTVRPLTSRDLRLARTFGVEISAPALAGRLTLGAYGARVRESVGRHFGERGRPPPRTVVELGRALTADAQALLARVITTRAAPDGPPYAILDAGINIAGLLCSERHEIFSVKRFGEPATTRYRLAGPICLLGDVIHHGLDLPRLADGDTLLIMDSGAYFEPDSTSFSFARPGTVLLDGARVELVRRPETIDDIVSRDAV